MHSLAFREVARRRLRIEKRDALGQNALHRTKLRVGVETVTGLLSLLEEVDKHAILQPFSRLLRFHIVDNYLEMASILVVDAPRRPLRQKFPPMTFAQMEANLLRINIGCSEFFRFQSFDHLRRLLAGFKFPTGIIRVGKGYRTCAEEILLISLSRLSFPHRWSDLKERFPGKDSWHMQSCFYWFLDFMIENWGYLLNNNLEWWRPRLAASNEAIRWKLANLNYADWRQYLRPAGEPHGFRVAAFIDNTLIAMCRPGGVIGDGPAAPRVPKEIQQAWFSPLPPFPPSILPSPYLSYLL